MTKRSWTVSWKEVSSFTLKCENSALINFLQNKTGVDEHLAKHYAHLFIRDPLVIFTELLNVDDQQSSDHFENIQSTNWQTMRFKPPPPQVDMGWRVEFRSMEIQLTDKANAAFAIFVVLLTRTILKYDLNFYIPLSKVRLSPFASLLKSAQTARQ